MKFRGKWACHRKVKTRPCCLSPTGGRESNLKKAAPLMPTLVGNWHDERCPVLSVVLLILNLCCSSVLVLFLVVLALLVVCNGRGWVPSHGCCCCHSCSWAVAATADALVTGAVPAEAAPVSLVTAVFLIVFLLTLLMSVLLEILYRFTLKPTSNPTPL